MLTPTDPAVQELEHYLRTPAYSAGGVCQTSPTRIVARE